jgi:hypothetical protein
LSSASAFFAAAALAGARAAALAGALAAAALAAALAAAALAAAALAATALAATLLKRFVYIVAYVDNTPWYCIVVVGARLYIFLRKKLTDDARRTKR